MLISFQKKLFCMDEREFEKNIATTSGVFGDKVAASPSMHILAMIE